MALRRYAGDSHAPPGLYVEAWDAFPVFLIRQDLPLPGPAERRFLRLPPFVTLLLAPLLGAGFVFGFVVLTPVSILMMPFAALNRRRHRERASAQGSAKGPGVTHLVILGTALFLGPSWIHAQGLSNDACLGCHRNPGLTMRLGDGTTVPLQVSPEGFASSAHGSALKCTACHQDITQIPHQSRSFPDRRTLIARYSQACTKCHSGKYKEFQESVHWRLYSEGNHNAPVCADCHSSHTISKGGVARKQVSHACAKCHGDIYLLYEKSVHGTALTGAGNPDVPTCSTCHRSHTVQDPRQVAFRIDIPKLCAECHENKSIMDKYGISTRVVSTYLEDFHGVSINLYRRQGSPPPRLTAVCTDCHGIHDIRFVGDPESFAVKANLHRTCQGCHPGAPPSFPAAWLSHYVPSPHRSPMVYYVKLFYLIFIPGIVGTITLHIGLDLSREIRDVRSKRLKKRRTKKEE